MEIVIDIGNSVAKIALVQGGQIVASHSYPSLTTDDLRPLIEQNPKISAGIISSTKGYDPQVVNYLRATLSPIILFDHTVATPLKNLYATPETLGTDRLAVAVGAWSISPGEELLIFDLGTAITIERVSAKGEYLGGNISPGLTMRLAALNHFTEKLPLVQLDETTPWHSPSDNTHAAIRNGVLRGIEYEIKGYIAQNPRAKIFFTGGDAKYFVKWSENAIFADSQLVIKGLATILAMNIRGWG